MTNNYLYPTLDNFQIAPTPVGISDPTSYASTLNFGSPVAAPAPAPVSGSAPTQQQQGTGSTDMSFWQKLGGGMTNENGTFNFEAIGNLAKVIGGFGQLWNGFQENKLAKETLAFQKDTFNTNLANQLSSYNTELEDRMRGRASFTGQSESDINAYLDKNKLKA